MSQAALPWQGRRRARVSRDKSSSQVYIRPLARRPAPGLLEKLGKEGSPKSQPQIPGDRTPIWCDLLAQVLPTVPGVECPRGGGPSSQAPSH